MGARSPAAAADIIARALHLTALLWMRHLNVFIVLVRRKQSGLHSIGRIAPSWIAGREAAARQPR